MITIELRKGTGVQPWYLVMKAENGEIIMQSEHYYSKSNAKRAANKWFCDFVDTTTKPYNKHQ